MVKQQPITDCQKLRLQAVHCKQHNQSWSAAKIGKHTGCSSKFVNRWVGRHQQSGSINDKPRSGRPPEADAATEQHVLMAAQLTECTSAADIAAKSQQATGTKLSARTVRRLLRKKGLQHLTAKVVPMLKPEQKLARVRFAKLALRRERCSRRRVLITDSKYFRLHAMGKPAGRWCTPATRGVVPRPKKSDAAHVYMSMCYHGVTSLRSVTGTHKQVSKYTDPRLSVLREE